MLTTKSLKSLLLPLPSCQARVKFPVPESVIFWLEALENRMSGLDVFFLRTLSRVSFFTSKNLMLSPELNSKDLLKVLGSKPLGRLAIAKKIKYLLKVLGSNPLGRLAITEKIFLARRSAAWV